MTSSNVAYAAAVLAIYLFLLFPAVYTFIKHGFRNQTWMGWLFYIIFCILRVTGSAMEISNPENTGAAIISSVGLSPLTIALGGILHEARFYLLSLRDFPEAQKFETVLVLVFHIIVVTAVALLAVGASGLNRLADQADPTKLDRDWHLAGGGAVILLLVVGAVSAAALFTYHASTRGPSSEKGDIGEDGGRERQRQQRLGQKLVAAVAAAAPVLSIRIIGSVAFYFGRNMDMNPITGTWGFRVGLYLVPEVIAALTLLAGGLVSRNLRDEAEEAVGNVPGAAHKTPR